MSEPCGCCAGVEAATPVREVNPPGLSAIRYRVATHAVFYERMLARLASLAIDVPSASGAGTDRLYPLQQLTTRDPADPAIALLDAWAMVADVLTFYQERIANEGYLPTAIERRSILELARLIGYQLRPGVAATVYLAFTVATGFKGELPAGTRAQSLAGTGESSQFFETSDALKARDTWNAIRPRLTRTQIISPHRPIPKNETDPIIKAVTDVDVIDTVYLDGIATNLKQNDVLLFDLNQEAGGQYIRTVEMVDAQADDKRTEVILAQYYPARLDVVQLFIDKATFLFPGSAIAQDVIAILQQLSANWTRSAPDSMVRGAIAQLRTQLDIAQRRRFTRLSAWIGHLIRALPLAPKPAAADAGGQGRPAVQSTLGSSPLANLMAFAGSLARAPSLQPANNKQLGRSVAQSFSSQSDLAPRLVGALKPAAADSLYQAWANIAGPTRQMALYAMRIKATLFAGNYAGVAVIGEAPIGTGKTNMTMGSQVMFPIAPTISRAWGGVLPSDGSGKPVAVALDATYDQVKPGSWVVIDRPAVSDDPKPNSGRIVTYHQVTDARAANMDTGTGFTAKVTLLTLVPGWLDAGETKDIVGSVIESNAVLRETIVYANSDALQLTEEPLDTDVGQDSIELLDLYDGLEAGRWIIVSGNRTDIPNVSGVAASELVMLAGVSQGTQAPLSVDFPLDDTPFAEHYYTTAANAAGDRLVVGRLRNPDLPAKLRPQFKETGLPTIPNQQFSGQVQLAPGIYATAYVPTQAELGGLFADFDGLLVNRDGIPYPRGFIYDLRDTAIFAWRIASPKLCTVLTLANRLAYRYDTKSVVIYGNVAKATHGQTVGEVAGDGDGSKAFQNFAPSQSPLTYVSAQTPSGAESTLTARINEIKWHETGSFAAAGPRDRIFVTRADAADRTTMTFGNGKRAARLPTGSANVKLVYRYGIGKVGNVKAGQISQLATHPLGAQEVINPLRASGGANSDSADQARRNAPLVVRALDRLVSVQDYADFARTYAGISKASAIRLSDGRRQQVHVTVAGADDIPIDENSDLYRNLLASLETFGDPHLPVQLAVRRIKLLVISAGVAILPDYEWESVEPKVRAAVLDHFGFDARDLGQTAFLSEAIAVMQGVEGVAYVDVNIFGSVAEDITAGDLAALGSKLALDQYVLAELTHSSADAILPAELVFMTPDVPDTLILNKIGA